MSTTALELLLIVTAGVTFPLLTLAVGALLRPREYGALKHHIYESGELPIGEARVRYDIRFYAFALIFVIFDVEVLFLYPWAVVFREFGLFGWVAMMVFILVLADGLVYAWKKGVLRWV